MRSLCLFCKMHVILQVYIHRYTFVKRAEFYNWGKKVAEVCMYVHLSICINTGKVCVCVTTGTSVRKKYIL